MLSHTIILFSTVILAINARSTLWTGAKDFSNFNVVKNLWNQMNVSKDPSGGLLNWDKAIVVNFPRGTWAQRSSANGEQAGLGFYAKPGPNVFNRDAVALSYKVFFPKNFEWAKGGKLPGLYSKFGSASGNHDADIGFSYRVMWRAGGQAEAYVYTTGRQDPSLERVKGFIEDKDIGNSIGRGVADFVAGQWNTVKLFMRLNTFKDNKPVANGQIQLEINGKVAVDFDKLVWTNRKDIQIEGIMFQSFFGGNDVSWAPSVDQSIAFKDFLLTEQ